MRTAYRNLALAAAALVVTGVACEVSASTANIADAWLTSDPDGGSRTTVFAQDATFYAQADLRNAPDDTRIKAVWTAVDAQDTEPNVVIDEAELTTGDAVVTFNLTNDMLWPTGKYRVEIYLNGDLSTTLDFDVR